MPSASRCPARLGSKAQRFWREVTGDYELRSDELLVLEHACRELDLIEKMETEQATGDLIVPGVQGQPVAGPMLGELRAHRALLARLLNQLRLPDEPGGARRGGGTGSGTGSATTSDLARKAAHARWHRSGQVPG